VIWVLVHTVYRLRVKGIEHVPEQGPAVLVANHVSFVDALVITAASRRPIRFVIDHRVFRWPLLSFVFRASGAIPIASAKEDAEMTKRALDEIARALDDGELIGLFPEGRITDNGELHPFRPGIRRILQRSPVPVVPLALRGLWGSTFSRKNGSPLRRPFRHGPFSSVELVCGAPFSPGDATPQTLQFAVASLRGNVR
ncbi:MAG: 1-acyl-sn-glycerol-3-phosphate acyltransferase, partial [Bacteroidetes bacterium]|nr:1-acyl-sn-glycerol-3-phosphate acyltransferase [Bacteroidota bacterium]